MHQPASLQRCLIHHDLLSHPVAHKLRVLVSSCKNHALVQDHLLEVLKPGLAERAFSDGEYLIRQGDQGTHLLYIVEGSAEVLLKLSNPRISEHHR